MFILLTFCAKLFEICACLIKFYAGNPTQIKHQKFEWTTEHQSAFDLLKDKLCNSHVLAFLEKLLDTTIRVDASEMASAAFLTQKYSPGWRLVCFCSRNSRPVNEISAQPNETAWKIFTLRKSSAVYSWTIATVYDSMHKNSIDGLWDHQNNLRIQDRPRTTNRDVEALSRISVQAGPPPDEEPVQFPVFRIERINLRSEEITETFCEAFKSVLEMPNQRVATVLTFSLWFYLENGVLYHKSGFTGHSRIFWSSQNLCGSTFS